MGWGRIKTREVIFIAMVLATFMVAVEATIVATAMPTIVGDLGGLRYFSWVFGSYLLTQAVTIPIYGRLADFFGRKALLFIGIAIFLTGSILCGFAHSMLELILFRALQGIGAGGVQPVAITIVGDLYSGRDRARVQGILSTTWAFSAVAGPLLGAFLIGRFGWPIIFWLNVPAGLTCIAVLLRVYHEKIERVRHTIDYAGSLLLAGGVGTLMYVLVSLGNIPAPAAIALGVISAVLIGILIRHETRAPEPMMPLFLYRIRLIVIANAGNFCLGSMMMGLTAFMPTFVQGALGRPAVLAGSVLGAIFVGWTCGSLSGAKLQLVASYRQTTLVGAVPMLAGALLLTSLNAGSNIILAFAAIFTLGLGFGFMNNVFVISTQGAVGWELRGAATSSNIFCRQIGQSIGSACFGAVFNLGVYSRIRDAGPAIEALMDPKRRALLSAIDVARDANAVAASMHGVFLILLGLAILLAVLVTRLPPDERPSHSLTPNAAQGVKTA